jgi:hypothetical protein
MNLARQAASSTQRSWIRRSSITRTNSEAWTSELNVPVSSQAVPVEHGHDSSRAQVRLVDGGDPEFAARSAPAWAMSTTRGS